MREVLIHLNVEVPEEDGRDPHEIGQAILGAYEVGSDDDSVADLKVVVALSEEI